jgi:hypothetical protein
MLSAVHDRRDLLRLGAILAALLVVTAVLLVTTSSGGDGASAPPRGTMDGVLQSVSAQEMVLVPSNGSETVRFAVRDPRQFDLFHLETHARDRLPSRVHYERDGATLYATRVDDLPPGS